MGNIMAGFESIFKWAPLAFLCFSELGVVLFFLINSYKYFKSGKEKQSLRSAVLLAFIGTLLGFLLFHFYGKHYLIMEISIAIILFLLMLLNLTKWNPLRND
jgi:uncharacterized membrane protein YfcA